MQLGHSQCPRAGDGTGWVEADGRRGPTHGGSHAQEFSWWKVTVFGSPVHFAVVSTCAGATQVSTSRRIMRPRCWVQPGIPGSCGVGFGPGLWGDGSVPHGVSFVLSILP